MNAHNRRTNFLSGFNHKCNLCISTIFYIKYNDKIITHANCNANKVDETRQTFRIIGTTEKIMRHAVWVR